ncbi:uncharacterized protein JCM6883_000177 [Sporobolomyces salmoneus]|uniref:uncharacterized protein n=1 Tax=Sporobolomyces salmoneus TaxID=183962 RepID=UPI0031783F29
MCIVFFSSSSKYSLVLASNRDEFLARATTRASFHAWSPSLDTHSSSPTSTNRVLSGLDLEAGGTWLGIAFPPPDDSAKAEKALRIATLTNFTETILPTNPPRPSRGKLVRDFLDYKKGESLEDYLKGLEGVKDQYAGYNLLVLEFRLPLSSTTTSDQNPLTVGYCSNREMTTKKARILPSFAPGDPVRGLSNATLEAEPGEEIWPKVKSGCSTVEEAIKEVEEQEKGEEELVQKLWTTLSTASLSQISHRSHLRHTVLVRPLSISPSSPLPPTPPPLPAASLPWSPADLPESVTQGKREGEDGTRWYATRTQTIILIERATGRVVLREREGYRLEDGRPVWIGSSEAERAFEFTV